MFEVGDIVRRKDGASYEFPGVVVSRFMNTNGQVRYVVECTAMGARGCLHIFSERDIVK